MGLELSTAAPGLSASFSELYLYTSTPPHPSTPPLRPDLTLRSALSSERCGLAAGGNVSTCGPKYSKLLAYQFASPVRWIETQDVILGEKTTERIVEVGPADTLGGMARRTLASKYEAYDAARSVQRQILCYNKDAKEIYYEADPIEDEPVAAPAPSGGSAPATSDAPAPAQAAPAAAAPAPSAGPAAAVADAPVGAVDILRTLVAQKLKKPLTEVPLSKAIKDLVGGKSTLQNELLGDLGKEFGSTPEKPEDTPLDELGASMQATFNGQLGKQSSSLIARMVSSKMPGGFNITAVRKHLETRWGLGSGRQDGVLLFALTNEPASRIGSENDAKSWVDDMAQKYATQAGITLSTGPAAGDAGAGGGGMMMDPAAIDALTKDQRALFKQQLELFARYLKMDLRAGDKAAVVGKENEAALQAQLDLWNAEHGEFYAAGIEPSFSPLKARVYDSSWNWARQDALTMYYDIIFGRLKAVDREIVSRCILIMNRSNPALLDYMQHHIDHCPTERGETYELAKMLGEQLIDNCRDVLGEAPVYKDVALPTGPHLTLDARGNMNYEEVPRQSVRKLEHYVREMAEGGKISEYGNRTKVQNDLQRVYRLIRQQHKLSKSSQLEIKQLYSNIVRSLSMNEGQIMPTENGKTNGHIKKGGRNGRVNGATVKPGKVETVPFLHLKRKDEHGWEYSKKLTSIYLDGLEQAARAGVSFQNKNVLMTGAGAGSIGAEVLRGLISGGAKVIVTTSRYSREVTEYYQSMYARFGARGSQLVVVPFNQGSQQDVNAMVEYIYDEKKGLGWDLDFIVPFAAIPENGREIDSIDSKSELAHRIMLTNLLRMLGSVKSHKADRGFETRPAQVILPLSPNHGTFGNDGLYSESKLALETMFNRWHSESWGNYLTICGAVIGWTRGTGLMGGNNIVAEGVEKYGVRTFSQQEMAFNLLGLMAPSIVNLCQLEPVFADLNGGLQFLPNLKDMMTKLRKDITESSEIRRAVTRETAVENKIVNGEESEALYKTVKVDKRANMKFDFPKLPDWKTEIEPLNGDLKGMHDLEKVVVVTGFSEVGPWGNSRTRWEMEAYGEFSLEGCVEMAWMMGLIKNHNGPLKGKSYSGWVDSKSGEPVDDKDIKPKYEEHILDHSGIRLIEPELFNGYDPSKKQLLQEIQIQEDLDPFEASKETALEFKREHDDKVEIFELESGEYQVRLKKNATLHIPKALRFDRLVAGQVPTGWDAKRYGVPDDIISQVDPVTLYVLVCTAEALLSSGITDPYEFYKYVHISEVGNCIGSGIGGTTALRGMYKDRFMDRPLQKDILQESFINTMSAWVNMLLMSSTGPVRTPVGACATAVESIDIGYDCIVEGKARMCFVGGFDDFQEEGSYEFANMKATSNAEDEFAHGRTPKEMSRPTTTTRNGFMESQGCGMQVIMDAKLALDMGVPIYGVLGFTATATDKIGRSVPAPGQGVLTTAREQPSKFPSPLLDIKYRKRQMDLRRKQIKSWQESELMYLHEEVAAMKQQGSDFNETEFMEDRANHIEREARRQEKDALGSLGNNFWKQDSRIAPLRGALATWGLTIDDLDVASFHGTSTVANDKNESDVICQQMKHLGRKKGNALLGIFQKYLTGHPKGAAGAWMFNGCLQALNTGLVPGNRNADNVDKVMEKFDYIVYPSQSIQTDGIKAFSVTSFGFGQKGAQAIGIHPKYLFASLDHTQFQTYKQKVEARQKKSYRYYHDGLINNTMFRAKDKSPYEDAQQAQIFLNPEARVTSDSKSSLYSYPTSAPKKVSDQSTTEMVKSLMEANASGNSSPGVDIEAIDALNIDNSTFIGRNFTDAEVAYCRKAPNPQASFTGKWSAKEAVFKSLKVQSRGAGAPLKDIEINNDASGAPTVTLHGDAKAAADQAGVKSTTVSISHSDAQVIAVAISSF
ncbi:Fatty acid synthase subunit alpha [Salinomyces thailandicus]|uniref:Fatty acid synthase subunit alpha n=1 Tax=Salinomyces thailandicus TaxID=706561 RepID=A0A4U0U103_9PEZI|nr:Fatty acid synthase subunit alpha [Salinomyces thailandica]